MTASQPNSDRGLVFPPFTLDTTYERVLRGSENIPLRPKSFAVLRYLLENSHRLVTKEELMAAVWPQAKVVDAAVKVSILEIRKALGDETGKPGYIETVGRKGYRFIAPVTIHLPHLETTDEMGVRSNPFVVGRQAELARLRACLDASHRGKRQIVFVSGEAGIGKTTLIEAFLRQIANDSEVISARGTCIEEYGAGEAFLPILDGLEQICQRVDGELAVNLLRRYAPTWLLHLPSLIDSAERSELERQSIGLTPERRLREIVMFFETLARDKTVVLVLEDLHWLDPSSVALLALMARRPEPARLLLIGTYREGEVESRNRSFKTVQEELELHNFCEPLPLSLLNRNQVRDYLSARLATRRVSDSLLSTVYQRSDGNPLFMVTVTDYLVGSDRIVRLRDSVDTSRDIEGVQTPSTLRQLINRQMEMLTPEARELLEVASVAGMTFSAATLAAGAGSRIEFIEDQCRRLSARKQFLQQLGTSRWPDGTVATSFSFIHALYHDVIYDRVSASRRARLHRGVAERLESAHQGVASEIAAELAFHFRHAGDDSRAIRYTLLAAGKAFGQTAFADTIALATDGLKILESSSLARERKDSEMALNLLLGASLSAVKGYAAIEAKTAFSAARSLATAVDDKNLLLRNFAGLWSFHFIRAEYSLALEQCQQLVALARRTGDANRSLDGRVITGLTYFYLGKLSAALACLKRSLGSTRHGQRPPQPSIYGWDPRVVAHCYRADCLWLLGYPESDLPDTRSAIAIARELANPINSALAHALLAEHFVYRREAGKVIEFADIAITTSTEHGYSHWLALAKLMSGWALFAQGQIREGTERFQEGIDLWKKMGALLALPLFRALQVEMSLAQGVAPKELVSIINDGLQLSMKTGEPYYVSELYRLKGEVFGRGKTSARREQSEACFLEAIRIARCQKAKSLELRAAISLSRLWQKQGKAKQARSTLKKLYGWFTEGFDTPDLKDARQLLSTLR